jgi:putative transposase
MVISIPPRYDVSQVVGYIKGKSAIDIARQYIKKHEAIDRKIDQLGLCGT